MHPSPEDYLTVVRSPSEIAKLRVRAIANARQLKALAFVALRDGMPKAELRASNARAAARSVLGFARRITDEAESRSETIRMATRVPDARILDHLEEA
ncbi:hypothetical protein OPKNFCMD_4309 [Methylobacterium crusticola]|uniref:Uncharacterized protein n=2 Tax=Methylobacterium crusticola TaxID=1697972 RepID=A0ABQ4R272_9HYPH|nr:hypothetical protein OPKNFCMD_4309 [Methylobacterium crusticola]